MSDKDELAALQARVAELEAKAKPPEPIDWEKAIAEHNDRMHQMREGRMNAAMPPSALQDLINGEPRGFMAGVLRDNRRGPTSPTGMIPNSGRSAGDGVGGAANKSGWRDATPIGPPPGIELIDRAVNAALPHGPEWGKDKGKG
jgi:hypothetical protein